MKFGVLCNGNKLQVWQLESIRILQSEGHACVVFIENDNPVAVTSLYNKIKNYPFAFLVYRLWFRYLLTPDAKKMVSRSEVESHAAIIKCKTEKKGFSEYFNRDDIEKIRSYKPDFLLRYGFSILKGEILEVAEHGVWSYHHDDDQKYRGVPTGFWEILFSDPINGAILQRLTTKLDSGTILFKAYFATINHSWKGNLNNLLQQSTQWPAIVCRKIEAGDTTFLQVENKPDTPIYKAPGNSIMIHFLFKLALNKFIFHFRDLFLTEKWEIGIVKQDVSTFIKEGEVICPEPHWIVSNNKHSVYQADPFGFKDEMGIHILAEEFDYKTSKGIIVSYLLDSQDLSVLGKKVALEKPYHLAYPYVFENEGVVYCIPENSVGGDVDLYEYEKSSGKLIFKSTLVSGLKAVDASVLYHNKVWWLFFTDLQSTNERLHIWYAYSLDQMFKPHAAHLVKTDVRSSRPAGKPFVFEGRLLRPAQDCSVRSGRRICINEVIVLTETTFSEKVFSIINPPDKSRKFKGLHTFSVSDGMIIVDSKTEVFVIQAFLKKMKQKIRNLFR